MDQTLLGISIAVALALPAPGAVSVEEPPPNLLIIHTDEHNFRTLGCYRETLSKEQALMWGPAVVETPNIDWLARRGALCTSFYASAPVCSPSRSSFVSGRYPQNTPVVSNNIPMSDDIVTFAELLRRKGYATGYAGKWHLDGPGKPQWAPARHFGFEDNRYMFNRGHWKQLEITPRGPRVKARNARGRPSYAVAGADEHSFTTDFLADRAVEFIAAHEQQPFCFMLAIPDPHGPDSVRPPYDTMFKGQSYAKPRTFDPPPGGVPSWGKAAPRCGYGQALYYGMVKCIDDNVGKIIAALRERNLLERTIIVFTSDHGDLRGEHHRQNKSVPYEASAKIPFVIYYPAKIRPGTVIHQALSNVDFSPTILALMSCPRSGAEEGRDASALFTGGKPPAGWKDVVFMRQATRQPQGWLAAISKRYKLVFAPAEEPWLFDLQKDPDELRNDYANPACREVVRDLARALAAYAKRCGDPFAENPEVKAALARAGGVQRKL